MIQEHNGLEYQLKFAMVFIKLTLSPSQSQALFLDTVED